MHNIWKTHLLIFGQGVMINFNNDPSKKYMNLLFQVLVAVVAVVGGSSRVIL